MLKLYVRNNENVKDASFDLAGSKNAVLPITMATLLIEGKTTLTNVPTKLRDLQSVIRILTHLGLEIYCDSNENRMVIYNNALSIKKVPMSLTKATRYSSLLLGILPNLIRRFNIGYPGGCQFSQSRPLDIHYHGLREFGLKITKFDKFQHCYLDKFKPIDYCLRYPSVGATINFIFMCILQRNSFVCLSNCALEPEIINLIMFLNECGANIVIDKRKLFIRGVSDLKPISWGIASDRIEALTYMCLSAILKNNISIKPIDISNISAVLDVFDTLGLKYAYNHTDMSITTYGRQIKNLNGISMVSSPYPGIPTDILPIMTALCLKCEGKSILCDDVSPSRYEFIQQIRKIGADVCKNGNYISVSNSIASIHAGVLKCTDLRGGMACLCSSLISNKGALLTNADQLLRGYQNIISNLKRCGVHVLELL